MSTESMEHPTDPQSVLEQIRSTIASLDALRSASGNADGQEFAPSEPVSETPETDPEGANLRSEVRSERVAPVHNPVDLSQVDVPTVDIHDDLPECVDVESEPAGLDSEYDEAAVLEAADWSSTGPAISESFSERMAADYHPADSVVRRTTKKNSKIMMVDDEPLNVMTFRQHLKQEGYRDFITTSNATEALGLVRDHHPDVVLLDINMPHVSGLDILRIMGLDPALQHIPVLILTAATDPEVRRAALDLGASDFLSKPVDPNELLPRVRNAIILKQHFDMVANEAARLEIEVDRRTRQLEATRRQLILSLARAAEHRDNDTGNHVLRVGRYTSIIADQLGYPRKRLSMLEQAAQLHDVGKIGIPDSILFKPGKLDPEEFEMMRKHCALGKQIIEPIPDKDWEVLKTHTRRGESLLHVRSSPLLMLAAKIAQTHHEKWDGTGYPLGLAGEDIPLEGRIVAVADVYDALSSARPYKKPFPRSQCFEILESGRGKQFDATVLDAFFARADDIVEIQMQLMDEEVRITGPGETRNTFSE